MSDDIPALEEGDRVMATLLAMSVRNALEGTLHGGELGPLSLSDEQMRILNPIVRDAIATALHARTNYHRHQVARLYLDLQASLIPGYWEPAELLTDYVEHWRRDSGRDDGYEQACRRCGRSIVSPDGERWTHLGADGGLFLGCRAASFTSKDGWDESLDRRWRAAPVAP